MAGMCLINDVMCTNNQLLLLRETLGTIINIPKDVRNLIPRIKRKLPLFSAASNCSETKVLKCALAIRQALTAILFHTAGARRTFLTRTSDK